MQWKRLRPMFIALAVALVGAVIAIVSVLIVFPPVIFANGDASVSIDSLWGLFLGSGMLIVGFLVEVPLAIVIAVRILNERHARELSQAEPEANGI
jgi:uncharacterized membrane protein